MKCIKINKKSVHLLICLLCLAMASNLSAADKKNSSSYKIMAPLGNIGKKPADKKSAGITPQSEVAKPSQGITVPTNKSSLHMPSATPPPAGVKPTLPNIPARHLTPTAPSVLNPRSQLGTRVPKPSTGLSTPSNHHGSSTPHSNGRSGKSTDIPTGGGFSGVRPSPLLTGASTLSLSHESNSTDIDHTVARTNTSTSPSSTLPMGDGGETASDTGASPSSHRGGFVPTTSENGTSMFGTRDGTRIPVTGGPSNSTGVINDDGSVTYDDGTHVEHNDDTGETRITRPDGSIETRHRGDSGEVVNSNINPELGVGPGNDPSVAPGPDYNADTDEYRYSDGAGVKGSHNGSRGVMQANGDILFDDGTRYSHDTGTGRTTVVHSDGSTEIYEHDSDRSSGHLRTGPGIDTTASDDGGTDVYDRSTGTSAHFGGGEASTDRGSHAKYDSGSDTFDFGDGTHIPARDPSGGRGKINADGSVDYPNGTNVRHDSGSGETTVTRADGSVTTMHRGDGTPTDDSDSSDSGSSSASSDDRDGSTDSSDDSSDDSADSSDDSTDNSSDSSDDSSDDTTDSNDDTDSDEYSGTGFRGGSDGGPKPAGVSIIEDRVARKKGEKRDVESPDDAEPGNGGSAPSNVSQPSPEGGHTGSPLARPSADGHQSPIGNIVVPVKSRPSVGGGDCFKPGGCDNEPSGGFIADPFARDPVTNPGGN